MCRPFEIICLTSSEAKNRCYHFESWSKTESKCKRNGNSAKLYTSGSEIEYEISKSCISLKLQLSRVKKLTICALLKKDFNRLTW